MPKNNGIYNLKIIFSIGIGMERVRIAADPLALDVGLLCKTRNKKDRRGLARCLSDA